MNHGDIVREALNFGYGGDPNYRPFYEDGITALDALLATVERLTAERDDARAFCRAADEDARAAEALAERRGAAATLARSELNWCIGYASTVEHKAWRERLLKRLHVARAALADGGQQEGNGRLTAAPPVSPPRPRSACVCGKEQTA